MTIIIKVLSYDDYFQGTVFQTVIPVAYNPRTVSWVTTASLSIAFQAIPRHVTVYDRITSPLVSGSKGQVSGYPRHVLEDNRDNNNNRGNGRNCGCHEVTYNTDNRDYLFYYGCPRCPCCR